jgi:hypothetical protein
MNRFLKGALAAAIAGLTMVGTSAYAVPVSNAFTPGAVNEFSDDNAEIFIDRNGDGLINNGDWLIGVIAFTSFGPSGGPAGNYNQLSGIYGVEVTSTTGVIGLACGNAALVSCSAFEFGAIPSLAAAVLAATGGTVAIADPVGDGTTIAILFEHDEHPGNPGALPTPVIGGTTTSNFALAADGTQRLTIGLVGTNGDFFNGLGPSNLADSLLVAQGAGIGSISVDLTVTQQNFPGFNLGPDLTGRGTISRPLAGSPFPIGSDTTFFVPIERVPEPGTVSLLGLAMLALGFFTRRRNS